MIGLIKGAVLGGAVGYGAYSLDLRGGMHWLTYGLVGVVIGLFVGKPVWSHLRDRGGTIFTPLLKAIFGFGVCVGIYALVAKVWGGFDLTIADETRVLYDWQFVLAGAIGAVYGAFVEADDAEPAAPKVQAPKK